jgi:archaemetzincin
VSHRALALIPLGAVPPGLVVELAGLLSVRVNERVVVGEARPLPEEAYDSGRDQYRGDSILVSLGRLPALEAERLVALVEADCFFPGLNFVFGQAVGGGREALVALPRLRQSFYGVTEDAELFRERVIKEVVHELGHTWGLEHCSNEQCVMHFSNSLRDTDRKGADFCRACEALARRARSES